MPTIQKAPLSALQISAHNVRRTNKGDVSQLAASILAEGLINPLTVVCINEKHQPPRYEVIAGGKRLRAHQLLLEKGEIGADHLVDINVIEETNALEISLAENVVRERMHPHDEFVAFRDLAAKGQSIETIAARFGVTPLVVQRRLRLANVSPVLLRLFRDDKLNLDQMQAFALTEDHATQERVHSAARDAYELRPERIRAALAQKQIPTSDRRVRFVGLDVYEAAGGAITRDLFDDSGGGFVADENLLDQLVEERLQREAKALEAEGWKFVHVERDGKAWEFTRHCTRTWPVRQKRKLLAEEKQQVADLQKRAEELDADLQDDESTLTADEFDRIEGDLETVRGQIEALQGPVEIYTAEQMAKAGCVIEMGYHGTLEVERGFVPQRNSKAEQKAAVAAGEKPPKKKAELSEPMLRRFAAHRQLALQAELLQRGDVARAALAHALLLPLLFDGKRDDAFHIEAKAPDMGTLGFPDVTACEARARLADAVAGMRKTLGVPGAATQFWPWLLEQNAETVGALLGLAAVLAVDVVPLNGHAPTKGKPLEIALDLDMSQHWRATAPNFGTLVPRAIALEAVREVHGKDQVTRIEPMKKDALAGEVERLLAPFAWLPKPLRRADYKTPKPGAPAPIEHKAVPALKAAATGKRGAGAKTTGAPPKKSAAKATPKKPAAKNAAKPKGRKAVKK